MIPRGTREASLRTREEAFSLPDEDARGSRSVSRGAFPLRTLPLRLTLARSRRPTRRRARQRRRVWKTSNRAVV